MYLYRNTDASSCNNFCRGEAVDIINSECMFVALGVQHTNSMRRVMFTSVACLSL